jgi:hypothetical protein
MRIKEKSLFRPVVASCEKNNAEGPPWFTLRLRQPYQSVLPTPGRNFRPKSSAAGEKINSLLSIIFNLYFTTFFL